MWPLVQARCSYKICQVTRRNVGETLHITHWSESTRPLCAVVHSNLNDCPETLSVPPALPASLTVQP